MTWLLWRQHRIHLAIAGILLAAFGIPALVTGGHLADALSACQSSGCSGVDLLDQYRGMNVLVDLTIMVPLLIGVFWGAPIVGKELETGTAVLAWTQSSTRRHWLRMKLVTLFGLAALSSAAVSGLVTWWSQAHNSTVESRFTGLQFDIQGIVPVAYAIFAAAVGLTAGIVWRRALPAMATTVGVFVGVRLLVELVFRQSYMSPLTLGSSLGVKSDIPSGSLGISSDLYYHGHVVNGQVNLPDACVSATSRDAMSACMDAHGYQFRATYQPASRYWPFQFIEAGIFVALAAALAVLAIIWLRRHDA